MILKWFNDVVGEEACKARKRELLKIHHPDKHTNHEGNQRLATEKTKIINAEFDWLKANGWNEVKKQFNQQYASGGSTWDDFVKHSNFTAKEEETYWKNPWDKPFDDPINPFGNTYGTNFNGFYNQRANFYGSQYHVGWDKEYGYNESIFKAFVKLRYNNLGFNPFPFEDYLSVMIASRTQFVDEYNEYIEKYIRGQRKSSIDHKLEEMIQLVNKYSTSKLISSIQDRDKRIKAIVLCVVTTWYMENREPNLADFRRLTKALGIEELRSNYLATEWQNLFNNLQT